MIKTVELINFQSHFRSTLEMGNLTVLTGSSNSGKSAVLRALAGALRNDSVGEYISHGEKELKVIITLSSGYIVEWNKGQGKNQYSIQSPSGETEEFIKVGSGVPEEVAEVLGIAPLAIEGGDKLHINLQEQLEAPFLVGREYTPGYAAKVFGEITSAAKIQAAVSEANRVIRSNKLEVKSKSSELKELDKKLEDYKNIHEEVAILQAAKGLVADAEATLESILKIENILSSIEDIRSGITKYTEIEKNLCFIEDLPDTNSIVYKVQDLSSLESLCLNIEKCTAKIESLSSKVNILADIEIEDINIIDQGSFESLSDLSEAVTKLKSINESISTHAVLVDSLSDKLENIIEEIMTNISSLESCPVCDSSLSGSSAIKEDMLV